MAAARLCGINLVAQIKAAAGGDLDRVTSILRLGGYVQAGPEFFEIPAVMNGCSDFVVDCFGAIGKHARSAIGVYRLPFNFAVEVDAVVEPANYAGVAWIGSRSQNLHLADLVVGLRGTFASFVLDAAKRIDFAQGRLSRRGLKCSVYQEHSVGGHYAPCR